MTTATEFKIITVTEFKIATVTAMRESHKCIAITTTIPRSCAIAIDTCSCQCYEFAVIVTIAAITIIMDMLREITDTVT